MWPFDLVGSPSIIERESERMSSTRIRTMGRYGTGPRALTGGIAVLVLLAAAACSSGTTDTEVVDLNANPAACGENDLVDAVDRASGPFTYTDGRGRTISLDAQPTRIIADEESAAALMSYGIRPIAIWSTTPMSTSPILSCSDLTSIESVGESWGHSMSRKPPASNRISSSASTTLDSASSAN